MKSTASKAAPGMSRRRFLGHAGKVSSGLVLGFFLPASGCATPPLPREREFLSLGVKAPALPADAAWINAWIRISPEGLTTLRLPASEMGQGVMTALPMILAEELEADWQHVHVEMAPVHAAYFRTAYGSETMLTADSQSIRGYFEILRRAGAAARAMLIEAASAQWAVPTSECQARLGRVTHASSNRTLSFGALAEAASRLPAPREAMLKERSAFSIIGTSPQRLDLHAKVTGQATFGIDVVVPELRYAAVRNSPVFGGSVLRVDDTALQNLPGNPERVDLPSGVAVVADSFWRAKKAIDALKIDFDPGPNANLSSATISAMLRAGLEQEGGVREHRGDFEKGLSGAAQVIEATYEVPYLYHGTLEPMSCTAHVTKGGCELWVGTQAQSATRSAVAKLTGFKPEQIHIHTTFLGGGFGRRGEVDFAEQAVRIAMKVGKPVKVIWTREEDVSHGHYRPAFAARFKGAVGQDGLPVAWFHRNCGQNILEGRLPGPMMAVAKGLQRFTGTTVDVLAVQGGIDLAYAIPNRKIEYVPLELPIPVGFWRSVGHSHNAFFVESFLDELAHAGKQDPYELRRKLLRDHARALRVLDAAATLGGWGHAPPGRFQGIAFHDSFGTLCAQVAEISLSAEKGLTVHRVAVAVDPGTVIHPDIIRAQMEGCVGFGLSSLLSERIDVQGGRVVQSNFHDYPILRMAQMPEVKVELLESPDAPVGGIGEPGLPPLLPAVTNAIFAASGVRIRTLPLRGQKLI